MKPKHVARAVIFVAIAVALSPLFIPVGFTKCFPAQHMINVISAVMLGPWYAVGIAFLAAVIRNMLGLGTLLAFPGGMIGALLAGLSYRIFKNIYAAGVGEVIGTGILGSLVSVWIVGPLLMGKPFAVATLMTAFSISTIGGTVIGIIALRLLEKTGKFKS
ncbi:MAG: energy coupling factor transporter S component ThiW [Desulfobacterales bacterium]|nr:energy coupling factor transporter S component ThiW [Desulfobacterales bacterium]MDD4073285.1 energy coupling factor transporter S component ThiW [Desulfobacterales bacterium]MDD4393853.1 energy coupling factor transporter S component ThiW [Desulfobacterales bacterium]